MVENKKKKTNEENMPKPDSMKKANKKSNLVVYGGLILMMIVVLTSGLEGDIGEGIFLIAALVLIVGGIVYAVKGFKHRAK